ncbi:SURF1 family-domain-containing protein [Pisolithus microcarpus]|nr:SURF1 family-domain-containing protein [Pisolithus microcarpus]
MLSLSRTAAPLQRRPLLRISQRFAGIRQLVHTDVVKSPTTYTARKDSWYSPTILLLGFIPVFTFALGTWQLQRLQWKINLIDELEEKLERDPILLPRKINVSVIPEFVYRRVLLRGTWDHDHTMLLGPRVRDGVHGYHVVTPGSTVLVDRGFATYDRSEKGEVEVQGMLRTSHKRNTFTPDNQPAEGKWFWADVDAMAEYAGGDAASVQPVFIEQIFSGHEGEATSNISKGIPDVRNAHLSYVVTWLFTAVMLGRLIMKRRAQNRVRPLPR